MIVKAAIKYPDGEVITAYRHYHIIQAQAKLGIASKGDSEQGFVDHTGKFYTREQAKKVALKSNQIPKSHKGVLYSEDLWPEDILVVD